MVVPRILFRFAWFRFRRTMGEHRVREVAGFFERLILEPEDGESPCRAKKDLNNSRIRA
jgi:hypothetical protein